jgi:hypothetical protein
MSVSGRPFLGMRAWAEARFNKPADEITIADIERELPQRRDLPDPEPSIEDPLGGRMRHGLRPWPSPEEADDLTRRARRFEEQTLSD